MASEEVGVKIVRIVYDASKARDGAKEARRSLEEIEKHAQQTGAVISRMEGGLDMLGAGFSRVTRFAAAFGVALSLGAGVGFAKDIMQTVGSLGTLADQLTTNTTYLQGMQFAATQANVKIDDLEKGTASFALKLGQAAEGNKDAIETFQRLGVKILDAKGNVRPLADALTDSAQKLERVENANVKAALSTDLFDKAGRKMLSLLPALAKGQESVNIEAQRAGTVISPETIEKWDRLGSAAEKAGLQVRTFFAEVGAPVATDGFEKISTALGGIIGQLERGKASGQGFWATVLQDSRAQGRIGSGPNALRLSTPAEIEADRREALKRDLANPNNQDPQRQAMIREDLDRLNRQTLLDRQASNESEDTWSRRFKLDPVAPPTTGASYPGVKGAGAGDAERIEKLRNTMLAAAEAQDVMTAAALRGSVAFQEQDIKAKSLDQAMQAYGDKLDRNHPKVKALAAEIEGFNRRVIEGKAAESFAVATTELEKQNVLLAAELKLVNELPEVRARELALIRAKQEAEKGGQAITVEAIEARRTAIEQNERLKIQQEDLKRAQELWTEPLKRALGDIQSRAADMWENILTNGRFSMQEFGQLFIQTARRAGAELLALGTIRPVIGMAVEGLSSVGLVSPGTVRQLGYGDSGAMGVGGLGMPSMGGTGLFGGSVGGFFSQPIGSLFPSSAPAGGFADVGALLRSGQTGASASASGMGGLGGISIGQGLGALAGFGMGAYNLINAKSTGQTIGGIGSMVGAAVSLIPGIGQIAGPIISIASALLPSLLGEGDTRTHNSTNASLRYGSGGYGTSGGAWGPGANVSQSQAALGSIGGNIGAVYDLLGGVKDSSKVWGMDLSSWTASGKDWSYTSRATHLVDPSGNRSAWRMNEANMVDTASAQVAMRSILGGAVGEISANMRTAVTSMLPATTTLQDVAKGVVFVTDVYEKLGKAVVSIEPDLDALEKQFREMSATATSLGLSLEPVAAEQQKQTRRLAQDFIDNMLDPLAVQMRALDDQRASSIASAEYIRDNVEGVYVDLDRITAYWAQKRLDTEEQYYASSVGNLQDLIKRLTYGDLSQVGAAGTLSGTRGAYEAALAKARTGDLTAVSSLSGLAENYISTSREYYAGSPQYHADVEAIRAALEEVVAQRTGGTDAGPATAANTNQASAAVLASNEELRRANADLSARVDTLLDAVTTLTAQVSRVATKR